MGDAARNDFGAVLLPRRSRGRATLQRGARARGVARASLDRMTTDEAAIADSAPDEEPRRRRVFFGLWPDETIAAAIVRATKRAVRLSGGRPIAKERLHITVAF